MAIPTGVMSCSEKEIASQHSCGDPESWDTRAHTEGQSHCPLLPSLAGGPHELTDATAEREAFKELVENDRNEEWDPLIAAGRSERDADHD
jgi:hypothetical protein